MQLNGEVSLPFPAGAALFTNQIIPLTDMLTVPFCAPLTFVRVYVKVSVPSNPAGGSYVKLPSAFMVTLPLLTDVLVPVVMTGAGMPKLLTSSPEPAGT